MAVMKMVALTMIGPKSEMEDTARHMVLTDGFQPLPLDILVNDRSIRSKVTTETSNPYDELLAKVTKIWKVADEPVPVPEPVAIPKDFSLARARMLVDRASNRLEIWARRRDVLLDETGLLKAAKLCVEALEELEFSPVDFAHGEFAIPFFGRIPVENKERFFESAEEAPFVVSELTTTGRHLWLLVMTVRGYEETAKRLLDAVYFKEYSLAEIAAQIEGDDPLTAVERRIENHERAVKGLGKAAKDMLGENRNKYERLYSELYTMQRVYDICKGRGELTGMYVLSGWIPEETFADVREAVEKDAPRTTILVQDTKEVAYSGTRVPTKLKNNFLFRSFQDIVAMYSLPSYGEIDPSPIVAITFVIFFGFMFGDVGHGLMMYLGTMLLLKKGILKKSFGRVIKYSAVSSMIFGVLYGSVFGIEGKIVPPVWLSPMENINTLIMTAIGVGVVVISLGMLLNVYGSFRRRDFCTMLFDGQGLAGLALYWILITVAVAYMSGKVLPQTTVYLIWAAVILLCLVMIFKEFLARRIMHQRIGRGSAGMNAFDIVHSLLNFLSNTTSFVRLAAFALNHVGLSMAVIMLSEMLHKLPGGIVMKGLMLVVGHLIIVCLEGLIVFIQTLRLEYYEFFSKFYKGGGSVFKPVGWERDSVVITPSASK